MKITCIAMISIALLAAAVCLAAPGKPKVSDLWAAVSVSEPLVVEGKLKTFHAIFALSNDTDHPIDPKVASWKLIINGEEYPNSQMLFGNGPRDDRWKSLPAGDYLLFGYALSDPFKVPGTYTLVWRAKDFESSPVTFRIMKQK